MQYFLQFFCNNFQSILLPANVKPNSAIIIRSLRIYSINAACCPQMSHLAWSVSVCLCVGHTDVLVQKRLN